MIKNIDNKKVSKIVLSTLRWIGKWMAKKLIHWFQHRRLVQKYSQQLNLLQLQTGNTGVHQQVNRYLNYDIPLKEYRLAIEKMMTC